MKKRIAIDMDQVMADFIQSKLDIFNETFNKQVTKDDLNGKSLLEIYPEWKDEIYSLVNTYDFFRNLPVIEHSQEVIQELNEHYDLYIATAAISAPNSLLAKYEWLKEHFGFLNERYFVFCGDKKTVDADFLIDDSLHQLNSFRGKGIMYLAPHNMYKNYETKVKNWVEIREFFMESLVERS